MIKMHLLSAGREVQAAGGGRTLGSVLLPSSQYGSVTTGTWPHA